MLRILNICPQRWKIENVHDLKLYNNAMSIKKKCSHRFVHLFYLKYTQMHNRHVNNVLGIFFLIKEKKCVRLLILVFLI